MDQKRTPEDRLQDERITNQQQVEQFLATLSVNSQTPLAQTSLLPPANIQQVGVARASQFRKAKNNLNDLSGSLIVDLSKYDLSKDVPQYSKSSFDKGKGISSCGSSCLDIDSTNLPSSVTEIVTTFTVEDADWFGSFYSSWKGLMVFFVCISLVLSINLPFYALTTQANNGTSAFVTAEYFASTESFLVAQAEILSTPAPERTVEQNMTVNLNDEIPENDVTLNKVILGGVQLQKEFDEFLEQLAVVWKWTVVSWSVNAVVIYSGLAILWYLRMHPVLKCKTKIMLMQLWIGSTIGMVFGLVHVAGFTFQLKSLSYQSLHKLVNYTMVVVVFAATLIITAILARVRLLALSLPKRMLTKATWEPFKLHPFFITAFLFCTLLPVVIDLHVYPLSKSGVRYCWLFTLIPLNFFFPLGFLYYSLKIWGVKQQYNDFVINLRCVCLMVILSITGILCDCFYRSMFSDMFSIYVLQISLSMYVVDSLTPYLIYAQVIKKSRFSERKGSSNGSFNHVMAPPSSIPPEVRKK